MIRKGLGAVIALTLLAGQEEAKKLRILWKPTGIVAASDEIAIGVITAAREIGMRIPEELSDIGIDRHPLGETFGPTSMNQHPVTQGAMAVSQALAQLGGGWDERDDSHLEIQVELTLQSSTGPPPA